MNTQDLLSNQSTGSEHNTSSKQTHQTSSVEVVEEGEDKIQKVLDQIQHGLKSALEHVAKLQSRKALITLSSVTECVVANCEYIGLVPDNGSPQYYDRDDFWRGLNESWLFALACGLQHEDDLKLSEQELLVLRSNVIAWSDILELYGLVDYEMGFWEHDILDSIDMHLSQLKEGSDSN